MLYLGDSVTEGSGPTGPTVTLTLSLSLSEGGPYLVEVAGSDDFGNSEGFYQVANLQVGPVPDED